ncbi:hypothetical protein D6D24_08743 [Aureobasidium pullulans]|uniref:Uncharacterized protein n=1 Tax=Aureobasidium pullulans TaxID=5580 RepID=A0A4S8XLA7_AURPU|nr:hypothetical protein D6D24_08743 [Aureobasidium pullulans]THW41062.1 hypothetical protein D6D22_05588 [Aureobasidium pullulans]
MSKEITCVQATPAKSQLPMVSRCYRSVCKALLERVKEQKLGAKNPYLIVAVEKAVYQIEYCATILSDFEEYTGMEHMSNNIVAVLVNARNNTLEVMKQFESLIQPFKDEWITIPRHTADQIDAICMECTRILKKLMCDGQSGIRNHLSKRQTWFTELKQASQAKEIEAKETTQGLDTVSTEDCSSNTSSTGVMTPSEGWSDIGSEVTLLPIRKGSLVTYLNLAHCEGLVLGYLESLDVVQAANKDKSSSKLVDSPGRILLSNACKVLASEMTGSIGTSTVLGEPEDKRTEVEPNKSEKDGNTLDEVIETMDPEITDRDIATLVFHWTTLDKFNGFTRVQSGEA